jgi:hypothetical protein
LIGWSATPLRRGVGWTSAALATAKKPAPSAGELLDQIAGLARRLKEIDGYYNHGGTILFALQTVLDRLNGRDF